jgi:hypothetical protein
VAGETVYVGCNRGIVVISISDPLKPRVVATVGAPDVVKPTSVTVQFRYAFVSDQDGLKVLDVTWPERASKVAALPVKDARDVYVAKTYAYISAGAEGLVIVDVTRPLEPKRYTTWNDDGHVTDLNMVRVGTSYDSTFAYLADGKNGMHVVQIVAPDDGLPRSPFGWSPRPNPVRIATYHTHGPAVALSKALDRDRAVDESGNQVAVFARIGGRPMNLQEMQRLYLKDGKVFTVSDEPPANGGGATSSGSK